MMDDVTNDAVVNTDVAVTEDEKDEVAVEGESEKTDEAPAEEVENEEPTV